MFDNLDNFEPIIKIGVIGVGGAGNNAVNRMIDDHLSNVEFYVCNTDKQQLSLSKAPNQNRIILGTESTQGLGAGGDPNVGKKAAEESIDDIKNILEGKDMVFIAAGMGGGTGTGGAPVIAKLAKEMGILTIAIVTRPFGFEGTDKLSIAIDGINELKKVVDSIIIVSNDKLILYEGTSFVRSAFSTADNVLVSSVKTVTDLIITPYIMNLDFADLKRTLKDSGVAFIGYGDGFGPNRVEDAVENAITSKLVETTIQGATRYLCGISMGPQVTMNDVYSCISKINNYAGTEVQVKFAISVNPELSDGIAISIVASKYINSDEIINKGNDAMKESAIKLNNFDLSQQNDENELEEKLTDVEKEKREEEELIPDFLNQNDSNNLF